MASSFSRRVLRMIKVGVFKVFKIVLGCRLEGWVGGWVGGGGDIPQEGICERNWERTVGVPVLRVVKVVCEVMQDIGQQPVSDRIVVDLPRSTCLAADLLSSSQEQVFEGSVKKNRPGMFTLRRVVEQFNEVLLFFF